MTQNRTIIRNRLIPILIIFFVSGFYYLRKEKAESDSAPDLSATNPIKELRIPATQIAEEQPIPLDSSNSPIEKEHKEPSPVKTQVEKNNLPAKESVKKAEIPIKTAESPLKTTENPIKIATENPKDIKFWFWFGLGENYQYQHQSVPSVSGQSKFQNIQGPSVSIASGLTGEKVGAEISYKQIPGRMDSSPTVSVVDGNFTWRILSLDGLYKIENSNTALKGGLQFDSVPYMDLNASNSTLTVRSNTITSLKFGFEKSYLFSEKVSGEWTMQYHQPLLSGTSNGNTFNIKPEFAFNGSLGGIYKYNDKMYFGLFWYGQWYQYNFEYGTTSSTYLGRQVLFYSNLDLRIGWKF